MKGLIRYQVARRAGPWTRGFFATCILLVHSVGQPGTPRGRPFRESEKKGSRAQIWDRVFPWFFLGRFRRAVLPSGGALGRKAPTPRSSRAALAVLAVLGG